MKKGILLIISGPSGAGKGTVVSALTKRESYSLSISATTRAPRNYEVNGVHYFFHTKEEFAAMREAGELLESAEFCGNFYGTPRKYVDELILKGQNVILEIEVQGALQVKKIYPEAVLVFLMPPSAEELKRRLVSRNTEDENTIDKRLHRALEEIEILPEYDYVVVNEDVKTAEEDIDIIVKAELMKCGRNLNLKDIFKGEM